MEINWEQLRQKALEASKNSYSPYSNYPVGAAAMVDDGRIITGANVENASYGLTLCAECSMIGELFSTGGGKLVAFCCVDSKGVVIMPCGRCRQLLSEHAASGMMLETISGIKSIEEVIPDAFGPNDLEES
jgi:cytidine deaminase